MNLYQILNFISLFCFFFFSFSDELRPKHLSWHYNILNGVNLYKKLYSTIKYVFQSARYSNLHFLMYSFCLCKQYWFATPRWLFPTVYLVFAYYSTTPFLYKLVWYRSFLFTFNAGHRFYYHYFFGVFFFNFQWNIITKC